jgi:hypothetical protein
MKIAIFALHKSASMFLYEFYKTVCRKSGNDIYSVHTIPGSNLNIVNKNFYATKNDKSCLVPARFFPETLEPNIQYHFVLRDPLDLLVSEYYSYGWMHRMMNNDFANRREKIISMTVDEYCLEYADDLFERYSLIFNHINKPNVTILLYSEMVLNFQTWAKKAVEYFDLTDTQFDEIVDKFSHEFAAIEELEPDKIKSGEKRHKRKMYPGDHIEKLEKETIDILKIKFKPMLELLDQYIY